MRIPFGQSVGRDAKAVVLDTALAVNSHAMFLGTSGVGKTHNLRSALGKFAASAGELRRGIRIHVIDVHGDIHIPGASEVLFSEASPYGFNLLEVNPDPHYGGVRRQVQGFIAALKRQKVLGPKQEAATRYLLEDLYRARGFLAEDPSSWVPEDPQRVQAALAGKEDRLYLDVAFEHRERFKSLVKDEHGRKFGDFDPDLRCWWVDRSRYAGDLLMWSPKVLFKTSPTLDDLVAFAESKLKAQFTGGNGAAVALLQDVNKSAAALNRRITEMEKRGEAAGDSESDALLSKVAKAREKAADAYSSYLDAISNGRELDEVIRYNSVDVLSSVFERLANLRAMGIFRPVAPPFNPRSPVWRYNLKPLSAEEQRLFVAVVLRRIFDRAIQRGEQSDVVEVIVLDEAKRFATDDEDNILNILANEARKFGVALWCASQHPNHFAEDFIRNCALQVVLGLDVGDAAMAARKLGIDAELLSRVIPKETALIRVKNAGEMNPSFVMTRLS